MNKLDFFYNMMEHAIMKGNYVKVRTKHFEISVKVIEENVGYYSCEGINLIYIPMEHEIVKAERYEAGGFYKRMVKLNDETVLTICE